MTGYLVEDQGPPPEDDYSLRKLFGITDPRLAKAAINKDAIRDLFQTLNYVAQDNPALRPDNPEVIDLIAKIIYNLAPKGKELYKEEVERIPLPDTPRAGALHSYLQGRSEGEGGPQIPNAPPVMTPQYRRNAQDPGVSQPITGPGQGWPSQLPYEVLDAYPSPDIPVARQGPPSSLNNAFPQGFGSPGSSGLPQDNLQGLMSLFRNTLGAQKTPNGPSAGASFNPLQSLASLFSSGLSPSQPSPVGSSPVNLNDVSLNPLPDLLSLFSSLMGSSPDDESPTEGSSLNPLQGLLSIFRTLLGSPQEEEEEEGASLNPLKNLVSLFGSGLLSSSTPGPIKNSPANTVGKNPLASLLGKFLGSPGNPATQRVPEQETPISAFDNPLLFEPNQNPGHHSPTNQNLPTINVNDIADVLSKLAKDPSINPSDPDQPTDEQRKVLNLIVNFMIRHRYTNLTDDKMAKVDETVKEFTTNLTKDIKRLFGGGEEQKMSESQQMEEMVEGVMQLYPEISEENARELAWVLRDNGLRLKQHLDGFLDLKDPKTRYEEYTPRPDAVKFRQQPGRDVLEANARRKLIVNQGGNQARRRLIVNQGGNQARRR
ncbi:unnamed protein product [Plutella xylostella]|uniref:(diamondback moth) hypothetical protein n=1 Tax=Plutella xylostella TaxID=51655 RepID=A0A8S4EWA0_PLUXY|nr:unnamed protein product [Plutella xylostella]